MTSETPTTAFCGDCRWFDPTALGPNHGQCRVAPPECSAKYNAGRWPTVNIMDWCAAWTPAQDEECSHG